jgi:hypothetical protein
MAAHAGASPGSAIRRGPGSLLVSVLATVAAAFCVTAQANPPSASVGSLASLGTRAGGGLGGEVNDIVIPWPLGYRRGGLGRLRSVLQRLRGDLDWRGISLARLRSTYDGLRLASSLTGLRSGFGCLRCAFGRLAGSLTGWLRRGFAFLGSGFDRLSRGLTRLRTRRRALGLSGSGPWVTTQRLGFRARILS